ncbi:DUF1080 domain-containing protein [Chitinophaga sedimenti]|uniref:3-keto-disaccharide hydrolase n=1 Tax=Chitinophaga sedimenti TaxID=2033606 RepID=UPI0020035AC7|nr:DUF1080 domain-containing protein [Chitinophaga sedimenti]MCK7553773.1 DUF1080 domain-containing protein [Chitinophaga sedimenti]
MRKKSRQATMMAALLALSVSSCTSPPRDNSLSAEEKKDGWTLLFDGETLSEWHVYNQPSGVSNWKAVNHTIYCDPTRPVAPADLVTNKIYKDYILQFDWKLSEAGNSGVFINVLEDPAIPATWASGPEYQLLDAKHPDYSNLKKRPGCLYNFAPQANAVEAKHGDWNTSRIEQQHGKVKFYLNDILTAEQDFTTAAWRDTIANTHFREWPEFGKHTEGHIALQDWKKGYRLKTSK